VSSPSGANANFLYATAAVSANDVWAVGISNVSTTTQDRTLAEHWNGSSWGIIATPNPGSLHSDLFAVTAISTSNVWAVGAYQIDSAGHVHGFAEHWNGSSWSIVFTPNPSSYTFPLAVTAVSSTDIWVVGAYFDVSFNGLTFAQHWNGSSWTTFFPPNPTGFDDGLFSVSALSASDVWAVGSSRAFDGAPHQSLAEHWNGSSWSLVTTPNLGGSTEITFVNALEAGHAVAVGYGNFVQDVSTRKGEAWDLLAAGGSTSTFQSGPGSGDNALLGLDRSGAAAWAVGYSRATSTSARQTLAIPATWDSGTHTLTWGAPGVSANTSTINNVLEAVSAVSAYTFWGAGYAANSSGVGKTLTEIYCALHFSLTAPASTAAGSPFSITLTAKTGTGATSTGYLGTVHFTSSDPSATLPGDYTYVPGDLGVHTFSGVVLRTPCFETIAAEDLAMPLTVPGSATMRVVLGACQAPAGTPGTSDTNPASAGTPGDRTVNQSSAGTPAPRLPRLRLMERSGGNAAGPLSTAAGASVRQEDGAVPARSDTRLDAQTGTRAHSEASTAPAVERADVALSQVAATSVVSPWAPTPTWLLVMSLLALPLGMARLRRRRAKERSYVKHRT